MASKAEIVECVARATGMSKKDAADAVDATCKCVARALAGGEKVQMPGFGTFVISHRAAREGRNPQTGATIQIKASNNVRFKAAKALKDAVN